MSKKKRGSLGIDNAVRANIDMRPRFTPNPDMAQYNPRMDADGNIVADIPAGVSYQDLMDEYLRTQSSPTVNNIQTHTIIYPEEPQVSVSAAAASPVVTIAQVPQQQSWLPYMFMSSLLGKSNKKESLEDRLNTVADVINGRKPLEALQPSSQVKRRGPRLLTEGLADKAVQYALMKNWLPQQQSVVTVEQPGLQQSMPADAVRQVAPPIQTYPPMPVVPNIQPPVTSRVVVPASAYTEQVPKMDEVYVAEPASSSSKSNTSNEARLWDRGQHHYKEMSAWGTGLSDVALAGILGNVGLESGFIPTATNGSHHGYLQNENSIRDFIVKHYGGYGHRQQMQYLHDGLTGRLRGGSTGQGKALQRRFNRYINAVKNVTDPVKAARLWEQYYEISGGQAMRDRERNAQYFYDQISSSGPGAFRRVQATVPRRYDEGGDLTDDGITDTPIRNYQWRTMPETDVTYNDYNTGLPVQAGDKVWTDENGNIVTTNSNPNVAADYAVQYGNPTFELDYPEITIEGNGKGYFTGESFADRYARELAAPIAKNVDVDPVFKEQAQALVDFEIEKERQHRANEEFNRQVDNFFGANWLRPSQLVGAFNPGGVDDGVTFGERFLLGTNNYGLWNPNSKFLREHPYLAEGANILFDLAAPQAILNGIPEMYNAARYNPYTLSRAMNSALRHAPIEDPTLFPNYRYKWGDLELNDPNLMYHHDYGNGAINYTNSTGANIINGKIIPGKSFKEGQKGYVWWNKGRPFGIGLSPDGNTAGFTRMVTTHADNPNLLQVRSADYPIGQWDGKNGFVRSSEYVSSTPVKVNDNSIYTFIPGRGFLKGNLNQIFDRALIQGDSYLQQKVRDLNFSEKSGTKLVNDAGNPQNLWHGSPNYFTEYDPLKFGTVTDDGYYGRGLYTSQDYNTAAPYGRNGYMYNFYVNSKNPFKVGFYDSVFNPFSKEELEVRSGIAPDFNRDTKHILTGYDEGLVNKLRTELTNSDAVVMSYPKGSTGFKYDEVVIPTPEQLKLADAVTFDDYGLIIPLSERDNFSIKDFRYSKGGKIKKKTKIN